ncbi:MAG: primosomal protein N' [Bacilli bacterium]|nr:primosomal protein N' [Bacilli bacterium]
MKVVEVLIEYSLHSLNRPFSYLYSGEKKIDEGFRVLINFNNKEIVGYVTKVIETNKTKEGLEDELGFNIDEIIDVIDETPLLNKDLLELADKVSDYYLAPKISVLQTMLPPTLSPRRGSLKAPKIAYDQYVKVINDDEEGLTPKQVELLRLLKSEEKTLKREIKSPSVLQKLVDAGRVFIFKEEKRRLEIPNYEYREPPKLTEDQQRVVDEFNSSNDLVYLLEGVTGSGKTEVYLHLSEEILKQGKDVLMLVPEISLTPVMVEYFLRRFKDNVAILHSELTPAEKYDEYRKIAKGECHIVVGARSAIFAPLKNIGLIILDEDHVESYKQDVVPFYHAREVGIIRGNMHKAKVLLASATPSLESRARAQKGLYHFLNLPKRVNAQPLPKTTIINLADYHNLDRDSYMFSLRLRKELKETLERKEQAILLINRRGFSSSVSCRHCGHVFKCPTCGIALTYHRSDNMLKCHHCDYVETMPEICPECGSKYLMKTGFGTERIEDEVNRLFPEARTLRLDSDSAKIRAKIPQIIEKFRNQEADILIGTQMIAKGHDFPNVTLVGIVLADIGLSMPSYRSNERAFQLITQAVGRSGRSDKKGQAIIQTYIPTHYAITLAARQNYEMFYRHEMDMRKIQSYPPYTFLASVTLASKNEEATVAGMYDLVDFLNDELGEDALVLGPTTPYIPYEGNKFVRTALIKYRDRKKVHAVLEKVIAKYSSKSQYSVSINIDPYNF